MTTPPSLTGSDEESLVVRGRLKALAIAYYVWGGLGLLLSAIPLIYVFVFGAMSFIPPEDLSKWSGEASVKTSFSATASTESGVTTETETTTTTEETPAAKQDGLSEEDAKNFALGMRIATGIFAVLAVICWIFCGLTIFAGRCIQKRKRRVFVIVMGCLNLLSIPFGTVLGIFTLIVLTSASAKAEFGDA